MGGRSSDVWYLLWILWVDGILLYRFPLPVLHLITIKIEFLLKKWPRNGQNRYKTTSVRKFPLKNPRRPLCLDFLKIFFEALNIFFLKSVIFGCHFLAIYVLKNCPNLEKLFQMSFFEGRYLNKKDFLVAIFDFPGLRPKTFYRYLVKNALKTNFKYF